ncbi:hypothetical protein F5B20DRAFT_537941 [Whalleya microplaca]|nr:hypothetical protein F5B20DRAFT_537941 [Whalleya microplaca]
MHIQSALAAFVTAFLPILSLSAPSSNRALYRPGWRLFLTEEGEPIRPLCLGYDSSGCCEKADPTCAAGSQCCLPWSCWPKYNLDGSVYAHICTLI